MDESLPLEVQTQAVQDLDKDVGRMVEIYEGYEVANATDYEAAARDLKAIKAMISKVEEERFAITRPMDAAKKAVMDFFRPFTDRLTRAEGNVKRALTTWKTEQDRIAQEKARKEQERARKEREKLEKQAEKARAQGKEERAQTLEDRAETVTAAPVESEAPKVKGISTRTVWKFEVTDESQVPREYLSVDHTKIGGVVRALKNAANIPGVRVYSEETMSAGKH